MWRVALLRAGLLAVVAVWPAGCGGGSEEAPVVTHLAHGRPNLIVIETDDQAIDTMQAMPFTQRAIGGHGVTFDQSIISFPLCCPSRATFLTGQYAHNHRVIDNHAPKGGIARLDQGRTLPIWLSRAGYRTGFVGKYLNEYGAEVNGGDRFIPPGWDYWIADTNSAKTHSFNYPLNENGRVVEYGHAPRDYKTNVFARKAESYVRSSANGSDPFFLWVTPDAPHLEITRGQPSSGPVTTPRDRAAFGIASLPDDPSVNEADVTDKPRFVRELPRLSKGNLATIEETYRAQLRSLLPVDDLVRRLVLELRRLGELHRTVIVFTSDNGFLRGQHRLAAGKAKMYEPAIRVPLLVRGPSFPQGVHSSDVVANVDLAPTLLHLAHARADLPMDGTPLTAAVDGRLHRTAVLLEVFERKADRFVGLRTQRWAFARHVDGEVELYDLEQDPNELQNLAGDPDHRAEVRRLTRRVNRLRSCAGADCR